MAATNRPAARARAETVESTYASVGYEIGAWRARALNVLLIIVAIAATWRVGQSVIQAIREPAWWPATLPFVIGYAFLAVVVLLRRIDYRLRAWAMLLAGYGMTIASLAMFGMLGNSLVYLLALPLLGTFLLGPRSGLSMAAISLALFGAFAGLAYTGWLSGWLVISTNTTQIGDWLGTGVMFAGMLLMTVILAWLFSRAQSQALLRAHQAGSALAQAHQELQARAQDLDHYAGWMEAAADIARQTTSLLDRDTLMQRTAALIATRLELDLVAVYLPATSGKGQAGATARAGVQAASLSEAGMQALLELAAASGPGAGAASRSAPEVVVLAVRHSQAQAGDSAEDPGGEAGVLELGIPVRIAGQPVGALYVRGARQESRRTDRETGQESRALQVMADQLAVAMESARLFAETQSNLRELDSLYRQYTAEAWTRFTAARQQVAEYQAPRGLGGEREPAARIAGETWQTLFEKVRASGRPEQMAADGYQLLAVPVKLRDVPVGALGYYRPAAEGRWREDQVSAVEIVTERLAVATENLRLLEESQRSAAREAWITQVSDRMQRSSGLGALLEIVARELAGTLGAGHALVQLADERTLLAAAGPIWPDGEPAGGDGVGQ